MEPAGSAVGLWGVRQETALERCASARFLWCAPRPRPLSAPQRCPPRPPSAPQRSRAIWGRSNCWGSVLWLSAGAERLGETLHKSLAVIAKAKAP
eukprot:7305309-Prymnesium_polylepis.2